MILNIFLQTVHPSSLRFWHISQITGRVITNNFIKFLRAHRNLYNKPSFWLWLDQWSSTGGDSGQGTFGKSGDIFDGHTGGVLASSSYDVNKPHKKYPFGLGFHTSKAAPLLWSESQPSTQGFALKKKKNLVPKKKKSNTKSWLSIKHEGTDWNQLSLDGNSFTSRKKEDPTLAGMSFATEGSSKEWAWLLTLAYTCKGTGRVTSRIRKIKVSCTTLNIMNC